MQIHLLRHGIAEVGKIGMSDSERALVPEGKKKLRAVLRIAKAADVQPTLILTSPYRRAVETAEIAATELGYSGEIVKSNALRPGCAPEEVWDEIRTYSSEERILLSGHEPLFGYLAGFLLSTPSMLIDVKKGSLIRIDMDQIGLRPRGVLRWYLTPKLAVNRLHGS